MRINKNQANAIVHNLGNLIQNDIFIFNEAGEPLAYHAKKFEEKYIEYANKVIQENRILIANEPQLDRKSIFIPVILDQKLVAIVGLSGDFENVSQYVEIIVKVTKLLLNESIYYEFRIKKRENNQYLVNQLLLEHIDLQKL
jgi:carbohydrate diacid regulator